MLKLLYKTLLVSVLSGSLLLLDFSYKGAILSSAMAETVKTDKIKDTDLMGTLTMTVVGVLAKRLYSYKPTTDIMLAAAGGAIFIAGEVVAFIGLKDVLKGMEEQITRDKNGNVNKEQIESLERLKKTYEEAKKTANTKKMLQMAAAAAFAAAAAAAYTMAAGDLTTLTTCTTGIGTALSTISGPVTTLCSSLSSNPYTASQGAACFKEVGTCLPAVTAYEGQVMSYEMARQAPGPSMPGLTKTAATESTLTASLSSMSGSCGPMYTTAASAALQGACQPLVPKNLLGESGGLGLTQSLAQNSIKNLPEIYKQMLLKEGISERHFASTAQKENSIFGNFLNKTMDLFFPQARAELFSAMGIASSLAISFILATSATIGPAIDMFMLIPQKRAIVWGILSALTFAATTSTNNVIAQIESNIKKIDEILKAMYSMADGATGTQIAATASPQIQSNLKPAINGAANAVNYEAIDLSNGVTGTLPCGTGEEGQKCKLFEDTLKDLPSYEGLNAESQLQLSSIMKTASGLSGTSTISSGTLSNVSKLAAQSNALKSSMDKAKAASAASLKKSGSALNIDAESKKLSDQMEKAINDNLKKNGTTANAMAANLQGGRGFSGSATTNANASDAAAKKAEADALAAALARAKAGVGVGGAFNINAGTSEKMDLGLTGVDNGSNGQMSAEELAAYNQATKNAAGNIDDYDIKNDISKDTGANLFELISNRYQQSGYPRLFKLKEAQPAATQSVKK